MGLTRKHKRRAFTLVETVLTLVLVSLLASYAFTGMSNAQKYMMRGNIYSKALFIAMADLNRGVALNTTDEQFQRITTVTADGQLYLVRTEVIGRTSMNTPVDIVLVKYKE